MPMNWKDFLKKHSLKEGNHIEASDGNLTLTGTIVPSNKENLLVLKLESGYNAGIRITPKLKVKKIGEGKKVGKAKPPALKKDPNLPTVSILQIGGTIAARVDYRTGAVFTSFEPEDLLAMAPELSKMANIESRLISNMFSEDMCFANYSKIAKEIEKEVKKGAKGIILPHGTDTMGYTAAAMSFMLEKTPVPVILVGSQRSTDRGSTDAIMNLVCAMEFITKTDFAGIGICMHETTEDKQCAILPGCKTRKLHTSRRDAFKAVNDTPIARIDFASRKIEFLKKNYPKRTETKNFKVKEKMEPKVALLKVHPNLQHEQVEFFEKQKYKGLVIEGTGLGQAPVGTPNKLCMENANVMESIKSLLKKGCIVVMTSQCIFGRVQMHVYSNAVDLAKAGVVPGEDMLPETAFVKLAWLLGNYPKKEAKELIQKNLRGEITECTSIKQPKLP